MTAYMSTNTIDGNITVYCGRCFSHVPGAIFGTWANNYSNIAIAQRTRDEHNEAKHPVFKTAVLANLGSLGNGYHVSAEDFTASHHGAGEGTPEQAIEILRDRIKELRAKANARDLDAAREEIQGLKQALKMRLNEAMERETLIEELRATIQELLETPDPMPLCKNLEGHNYVPLDQMFVFCNRCGHSIHYKAKD